MATIRSYTTIEQSKVLAKILPFESADMVLLHEEPYETSDSKFDGLHQALCVPFSKYDKSRRQKYKNISYFPCWSLVALLSALPWYEINNNGVNIQLGVKGEALITDEGECLLDLVVNMIIHLHELDLL